MTSKAKIAASTLAIMVAFSASAQTLSAKDQSTPRHFALLDHAAGWKYIAYRDHSSRCTRLIAKSGGRSGCSPLRGDGDIWTTDVFVTPQSGHTWVEVETSMRVGRLQLDLLHGKDRSVDPAPIGFNRARKARLPNNFRYSISAFSHCVSLQSITAYDVHGAELDRFPPATAPPSAIPDLCKGLTSSAGS
jgi:hypothetical protein